MKKTVSILLVLLLALTLLPAPSLAAGETAVPSPRGLRVDGKRVTCAAWDIGGDTWFRLRDVAQALAGTGSRFSVEWDAEARAVTLTTGEAYEPDGSEGAAGGTALRSGQTILIDGREADLPAWNIGGHNYFRLEDLAPLLGFQADRDEESGTAIIRAKVLYTPTPWLTQELYIYDNSGSGAWHHEVAVYDSAGRQLTNLSEGLSVLPSLPEGVEFHTVDYFYYDALGRRTEYATDRMDGSGPRVSSTFTYDIWGQLVRNGGGELNPGSATTFTYDDRGNLTALETINETPAGQMTSGIYTEYDENDHITKSVILQDGTTVARTEYVNDAQGNVLREERYDPDGNLMSAADHEYADGRRVRTTTGSGPSAVVITYGYDEAARTYTTVTETPTGTTTTVNTLDEAGRPLRQETVSGDGRSVTAWEYDGAGRLLRQATGDPSSPDSLRTCTYDGEGNILTDIYEESGGYREETVYTYDYKARKMTRTRTTTYPEASEIVLYNGGSVTLAAGESSFLHWYFLPHNALAAAIDWVSSDESIATVDASGVLTAVAPGEATITGTSERNPLLEVTCTVTVTE